MQWSTSEPPPRKNIWRVTSERDGSLFGSPYGLDLDPKFPETESVSCGRGGLPCLVEGRGGGWESQGRGAVVRVGAPLSQEVRGRTVISALS